MALESRETAAYAGGPRRLVQFLALSRTPHGLIDLAAPAAAALLALGHFPPAATVLLGLATAFAGYTAVYALNDLVDYRPDCEKVRRGGYSEGEIYVDGIFTRHPMAKGSLSLPAGLGWACGWALLAMAGAWLLNPVCFFLFLAGCLLEAAYCLLWRVTPLRSLVNGLVKTMGALAAVFAVQPSPSWYFLAILFLWLFLWEIGGQNIPNDWTDLEEDRYFRARTIPLQLGLKRAGLFALACMVAVFFAHFLLLWSSPLPFGGWLLVVAVAVNYFLILEPALELAQTRQRRQAMALFNRASHYPLATLALVLAGMLLKS